MPTNHRTPVLRHGILPVRLCRCPNHGPHIRLILVGHGLTRLVHDCSGTYIRPLPHVNPVTCNRDQRSCRCRVIINKHPHGFRVIQYQATQRIGIHHHSPVRVHVYQNHVGPLVGGPVKRPFCQPPYTRSDFVLYIHLIHQLPFLVHTPRFVLPGKYRAKTR